jgi:uncharacterized protein (TIRG00374 family)
MRYGLLYTFLVIIAVIILTLIVTYHGADKIINKISIVGLKGFFAYFFLSLIVLFTTVIGWHLILHSHEIRTSFLHTTTGQLIGYAISLITPSMYIGGEPLKAHYIGSLYNTSKTKVFSTAVFAKFQESASLLLFIYAGTLVMIIEAQEIELPAGVWTVLLVTDIILGVVFILAMRSIIRNSPIFSHIMAWLARKGILTKLMEKIIPGIIKTEDLVSRAFRHNWKAGIIAFIFNFLSIALVVMRPVIFFYFLYQKNIFSLTEIAVMFTLSQILLVFQFTPGCIGIFEGGQIGIFAIIGIDAVDALSYLFIYRFVDLLLVGAGIYMAIHYNVIRFVSAHFEPVNSSDQIQEKK